jgi:hypothetical protein
MAKQKQKSDVNKSQAVRDLLTENPALSFQETSDTLAAKGINLTKGLFYLVRGGMKSKKRKTGKKAAQGMVKATPSSNGADDALTTIKQIKGLAAEFGGMTKLKALVEALSE